MSTYANRGQALEQMIEYSNDIYYNQGIANIQKIATPIKVLKISGNRIKDGFFEKKSTLDFRGVANHSIPIAFDAKMTENEEGFPLKDLRDHQLDIIRNSRKFGEISFLLVYLKSEHKTYLFTDNIIIEYYDRWQENFRKHGYNYIPKEKGYLIKAENGVPLDYIGVLREIIEVPEIINEKGE